MGKLGEPVTSVEEALLANTAWHTDRLDDDEGADLHHSAGHNPDPGSGVQSAFGARMEPSQVRAKSVECRKTPRTNDNQ
jgi:hypothetical protein